MGDFPPWIQQLLANLGVGAFIIWLLWRDKQRGDAKADATLVTLEKKLEDAERSLLASMDSRIADQKEIRILDRERLIADQASAAANNRLVEGINGFSTAFQGLKEEVRDLKTLVTIKLEQVHPKEGT